MVCIGIQQCPEYETLSFQDEGKVIKISGASTQAEPILIPISGENFSSLQVRKLAYSWEQNKFRVTAT